jgi:hypothetical protein
MQVIDESHVVSFADMLTILPDVDIKRPLWEFTPAERPAVIHERRRRFGVYEEVGDPEYS